MGSTQTRKREPSHHSREDAELAQQVKAAFQASRQVYGSPRIHAELKARGVVCSRKRVDRLMREHGLCAQLPRHRTVTTKSEKGAPVAANLLQQDFHASCPKQKWTTDTIYIWTRGIVVSCSSTGPLFAHGAASGRWRPSRMRPWSNRRDRWPWFVAGQQAGLLHHSDRGSTYISESYLAVRKPHGLLVSMSRTANCYVNAVTESFASRA